MRRRRRLLRGFCGWVYRNSFFPLEFTVDVIRVYLVASVCISIEAALAELCDI